MTDENEQLNWFREAAMNTFGVLYLKRGEGISIPTDSSILNLHGWRVDKLTEHGDLYEVEAEYTVEPEQCPYCKSPDLYRHGKREQRFHDLPVHNKPVIIITQRQRWKCRNCSATFQSHLMHVNETRLMTERLRWFIRYEALSKTFTSVAKTVGLTEGAIRHVFEEFAAELEEKHVVQTPTILGIDEIFLVREYRCVLTDIENRKLVDILSDRKKPTVIKYLKTLDTEKVEVAVMDMWQPYRDAVRQVIPHAAIVVDKFHVVRMANDAMETLRKQLKRELTSNQRRQLKHDRKILLMRSDQLNAQQRFVLDTWLVNFEELGRAYAAKEMFMDIWDSEDMTIAKAKYHAWLDYVREHQLEEAYSNLITACTNWNDEIFRHFQYRVTNAYTEAFNGILKLAHKNGRDYSFRALRAKMLFNTMTYSHLPTVSFHKPKRKKNE